MNIKHTPCMAYIVAPGEIENQWIVMVHRAANLNGDTLPNGVLTATGGPNRWIAESLMASPFRALGGWPPNRWCAVHDKFLRPLPDDEMPEQIQSMREVETT